MAKISASAYAAFLIVLVLVSSCGRQDGQPRPSDNSRPPENVLPDTESKGAGMLKGVSLSPKSFQGDDFKDFFAKAGEAGSIITWAGDWNELSNLEKGGPTVVTSLASTYKYTPMVIAQFFTQSTGDLLRPLDDATKNSYKEAAAAFAKKYKPEYLGFGIEVNILYEKSPGDFDSFVSFYSEVYDAVKQASPDTKVFTVFQLEKMKGLHGGLFGGVNDPAKGEWQLLERFPKQDLVAFTTYPGLIYKSPDEIPGNYYAEIGAKTQKPIMFVESGWHSAPSPWGWESSEAEQAAFVSRLFELSKEADPEIVIWSFLYDPDTVEPFDTMGLYSKQGEEKQAWKTWVGAG